MAAIFRGAVSGPASAAGVRNVTLPAGTIAGDWAILATSSAGTGEAWTWGAGWTELLQDTFGTSKAGIAVREITAGDVAAGYVTYSQAAAGSSQRALATYGGVTGFGALGAVTKRTASSSTITAAAVTLAAGQTAVVIRLEKSTKNPGPATVTPATTVRAQSYSNASAAPSVWIGDTTTAGARTFTDPASSGNGLGVQVALIDATTPAGGYLISVWNGTTEITGCTLSIWNGTAEVPLPATALTVST